MAILVCLLYPGKDMYNFFSSVPYITFRNYVNVHRLVRKLVYISPYPKMFKKIFHIDRSANYRNVYNNNRDGE